MDEETKTDKVYFYDSKESEVLQHEDEESCVLEYLEEQGDECLEKWIREQLKTLEVVRFVRKSISEKELRTEAVGAVDGILESLDAGYGDPNESHDLLTDDDRKDLENKIAAALMSTKFKAWRCEAVGKRIWTADEMVALVRENEPDWLEGDFT